LVQKREKCVSTSKREGAYALEDARVR